MSPSLNNQYHAMKTYDEVQV